MIYFDEKNEVFYLHTDKTSYAIGVYNGELPVHLYWGKRINAVPENWIEQFRAKGFMAQDYGEYSTDGLPLEYSAYGADLRMPTFHAKYSDGSFVSKFKYKDYKILHGKPNLEGLPHTYCESDDKTETLVIRLFDELKNVEVFLSYSVFEDFDVITRNTKIVNNGEPFVLNTALSTSVDFYGLNKSNLITLDGTWSRERFVTRREIVHGNQNVDSVCGASSAYHNPFMAICDDNATENSGNVYGFSLVYSGNFTAGVQMNAYNCARAYIGINPYNFSYLLENKESFQTPETVLVYSANGIGEMSRIYHKFYRKRLCRGKYRDSQRFVLINNWEATYFNFTEEKLVEIAKKASEIGVDTFVLDDGWFGKRVNDKAGLGDWFENPERLPNGLKGLADKINHLGMRFGIWIEPEMVNPDSDLYRKHPDWILHTVGREPSLKRNQLTLDLSRKDVCDYIIKSISNVLSKANIEYAKWDMNRYMSEVGSILLPSDRQGEVMHRYMLGLYSVLETITNKFPNILFESCASGGGRFDPGMLYYMPQTWVSDDTDAVERLKIQYGTSIVYPYSSMGAHVSSVPNHQIRRITPFQMRCNVSMPGQFGFELDLNKCTKEELEAAKQSIEKYRRLQSIFHNGECYRLRSPFASDLSAIEFISEDKQNIVLCIDSIKALVSPPDEYIKLEGLQEDGKYLVDNICYDGSYLMNCGILFVNDYEYKSVMIEIKKCN